MEMNLNVGKVMFLLNKGNFFYTWGGTLGVNSFEVLAFFFLVLSFDFMLWLFWSIFYVNFRIKTEKFFLAR
jgi:hypothetical protein